MPTQYIQPPIGSISDFPKILIVSVCPTQNIMATVAYEYWAGDLYTADFPEGWDAKNCIRYSQNPPSTSPEQMVELAKKQWPELAPHLDALDVQILRVEQGTGYTLIIKPRRVQPPDDPRYPSGFFPHRFEVLFFDPPKDLEAFVRDGRYRHSAFLTQDSFNICFDSHDELAAFISALPPTSSGKPAVPTRPRLCPHGAYKTHYQCQQTCKPM